MDSSLSAFAVYKNKSLKKRKRNTEIRGKTQLDVPLKKSKNVTKPRQRLVVKKKIKLSSEVNSKKHIHSTKSDINGTNQPDEEIPKLVPINDLNCDEQKDNSSKKLKFINGKKSKVVKATSQSEFKQKEQLVIDEAFQIPVFNPVTQGLAIFKWIIDPILPKDFFDKFWEKDVLFIKRSDPKYFKDVFSSSKFDSILREYPLHFTRNIDVVVYENGRKEVFNPEGRAVPSQLWDYYSNGCSIRLLNPQTFDQNVHSVISSLQEYFGTMVGANVYLTPPGSQGFAPHFDDIEAFIIQLEGCKHWKLYRPKGEDELARDSSRNFNVDELDAPFMEVTLNAGDVLYFPRGTIHEGHTQSNAHSLHITVSVYQHTAYADLLEQILPQALKEAAKCDIEFRRGLPLNYLKHVGLVNKHENSNKRDIIIKKVKSLVKSLVKYVDVDSGADNLGRKFMHDAMPPLFSKEEAQLSSKFDGDYMQNGKVLNRIEIGVDTKVRLLRYYAIRVIKEGDTYKLFYCTDNAKSYHGEEEQWLEIEGSLIPGIEMLQKNYPNFTEVQDLPIEEETNKLQLVSDLWERGLLVTESPLPNISTETESGDSSIGSDEEFELIEN